MNFGQALDALKAGSRVSRAGWNGVGMYIYLARDLRTSSGDALQPAICMLTAQQTHQPGWLASQSDMLADDWMIA